MKKPLLLLVDGHSLAFRSFYAFTKGGEGGLSTKSGLPTSVTYGFLKSLLDNCKQLNPKGVTIAFDTPEPTFRHKADSNYKANRDVAPEIFFQDLKQLQSILENQLNLPLCIAPGYEADDVLGTLAVKAAKNGWSVRVLSGDRDLFQLVDDHLDIAVMYMGGGPYSKNSGPILINEEKVELKLGVPPKKVIDLKALTGDSSDNIPGVKGVGPKTAINLLKENGDLDGVYQALLKVEARGEKASIGAIKGAVRIKLRNDIDNAYLSRKLAKIILEVPLSTEPRLELGSVDKEGLTQKLNELELNSLVKQVPAFIETFTRDNENIKKIIENEGVPKKKDQASDCIPAISPKLITNELELKELIEKLNTCLEPSSPVAVDTETTNLNPFKAELVGLGFCWGENIDDIAYIPIGHNLSLDIERSNHKQIDLKIVAESLSDWFESRLHPKVLQNTKYDRLILLRHGISLGGVVMDTLLADYVRDPNAKHGLEAMAEREFGFVPKGFEQLVEKGKTFADVSLEEASQYCGMDVFVTRKLFFRLTELLKIIGSDIINLLTKVEQPLEEVLATMEVNGITINTKYLEKLSFQISSNLNELENKAYALVGHEFNLSSPKQLGEVLFQELNLDRKKSRRTKTGWSTNANVLERLEGDHPIVSLLIEHRTLSKLLSTYVDSLPQLVEPETGRIHTNFNQAVTSTGRLSSSNPNLQNIPIKSEFSRRIRKAFLPQENWKLLSADYSQIELRILAHLSGEETLQEAYQKGEDVHSLTAQLLLDKTSINSEERRLGKTINFGVIYGMGSQRFARATGVSQIEAKEFLDRYKRRYPKVFTFLELQERLALSKGYVQTLLGRRRPFVFNPNGLGRLKGKDPYDINLDIARRGGIEAQQLRAAANAPIQGSSADIIKVAMIQLHKRIKERQLPAKILLQVHDELVLEVDPSAVKDLQNIVINTMENAVKLDVPLVVQTGIGDNWMDAK